MRNWRIIRVATLLLHTMFHPWTDTHWLETGINFWLHWIWPCSYTLCSIHEQTPIDTHEQTLHNLFDFFFLGTQQSINHQQFSIGLIMCRLMLSSLLSWMLIWSWEVPSLRGSMVQNLVILFQLPTSKILMWFYGICSMHFVILQYYISCLPDMSRGACMHHLHNDFAQILVHI